MAENGIFKLPPYVYKTAITKLFGFLKGLFPVAKLFRERRERLSVKCIRDNSPVVVEATFVASLI